ncbi:YcfA-like protein [Clostridium saccharobutylicum]|uniref:type II toxin-antitoxin system HicA family toxin n=1 Tax=Clostridium saccharobutylicum TaxID=169679 RepID=UPI000983FB64|nr:type II toxin-antitoxin system HicA family toxin [Clostridium saccharobutylicum]AQS09658.1 YcfA-like protein [Clostridium saccharobutylicum]MBC2438820.1 addiction module toxin, HicA family [Clostridium saccharobutylicum]NSB91087.1 putative RNA binding protein YcfA (HicA-like mRNA interferase family) [Clostridium saccharobutylicum]NYC27953.1 putative RNA binding protein YcfA (HicA-like mRNA interferase family) [Clostridium saccharobutylicum]OOM12967.1 YcfA-like protein [Clostridium saccharob
MNRNKIEKLIAGLTKGITWIERFNQLDKEYTDKVIDVIAQQEAFRYKTLDKFYVNVYALQSEIDNTDIENLNIKDLVTKISKWVDTNTKQSKEYVDLMKEIYGNFKKSGAKIQSFYDEVEDRMTAYMNEYTDFDMLYKRLQTLSQKFIHMAISLKMNCLGHDGQIIETTSELLKLNKIAKEKSDEFISKNDEQIQKIMKELKENKKNNQYKKIFDYKEMVDLAKSEGYKETGRYNGDHMIMIYPNTNKILVIPQKTLGYGLMLSIQKQIESNKAA